MTLHAEIAKHRAEIRSDGYSMSVGELISMYQQGEIDIRPQFQRFYRWTDFQKSRLVESLVLGIPIPSIFVSQRTDGVWDVIDGQQRLSTIFELAGILKNEQGDCIAPLILTSTKYLPSMDGQLWDTIGREHQLLVKRSKIDVKIILRESSEGSKYELFQRLNTGGSQLSSQEVRNAIAIMIDPSFYEWILTLADNEDFQTCSGLSDNKTSEQYDRELIIRFLALGKLDDSGLRIRDLGAFLDDKTEEFAGDRTFDRRAAARVFAATFKELASHYGPDIFKRFDHTRNRHHGGFLISAFEVFAIALSWHIREEGTVQVDTDSLHRIVREVWADTEFTHAIGSGVNASTRIRTVIPYGRMRLAQCLSAQK